MEFTCRKPLATLYAGQCVKKGKGFPYSIPSVGPGADPGVQAVSPHVTVSHPPGGRLPLLSARPAVTSPAAERQCVQCSIPIGIGAHEPRNGHCSATYKLNCMAVEHILLSDTLGKQSFFHVTYVISVDSGFPVTWEYRQDSDNEAVTAQVYLLQCM